MNIVLFFTYEVSLQNWKETGLFEREIRIYNEMISRHGVSITFLTYGDKRDRNLESKIKNIKVIPIYEKIYRPKNKIIRFIKSLFIPLYFKNELKNCDIYKTNQMWGSWLALISKFLYKKPFIVRCGWEKYFNRLQGFGQTNKYATWLVSKVSYFFADEIILSSIHLVNFVCFAQTLFTK